MLLPLELFPDSVNPLHPLPHRPCSAAPEMGIYKRKQESKKARKHAFNQERDQEKERKHALDQERDKKKR